MTEIKLKTVVISKEILLHQVNVNKNEMNRALGHLCAHIG